MKKQKHINGNQLAEALYSDRPQNRNSVCVHEAGHLLLALLMGLPWKTATVQPIEINGRMADGLVWFLRPESTNDLIRVLLGGYGAERVCGLPVSYGAKVEFQECIELAVDPDPEGWARALLWQVEGRLREHKNQLEKLASFLEWMQEINPQVLAHVQDEFSPLINHK